MLNNHVKEEMDRFEEFVDKQDQFENKLSHIEQRMEDQYETLGARVSNLSTSITAFMEHHGEFIKSIRKAFPKDEEGNPDYDGHRSAHLAWIKDSEDGKELKKYIQKVVLGAAAVAVVSWLWAVVWPAFLHGPK